MFGIYHSQRLNEASKALPGKASFGELCEMPLTNLLLPTTDSDSSLTYPNKSLLSSPLMRDSRLRPLKTAFERPLLMTSHVFSYPLPSPDFNAVGFRVIYLCSPDIFFPSL